MQKMSFPVIYLQQEHSYNFDATPTPAAASGEWPETSGLGPWSASKPGLPDADQDLDKAKQNVIISNGGVRKLFTIFCFCFSFFQCCRSRSGSTCFWANWIRIRIHQSEVWIRVRIRLQIRIRILLSLSKNSKKNLDFYCFCFWLFTFEKWCKSTFEK